MKTTLKSIILAVPALSKVSAGNLTLRLAYKMKQSMNALQKEADFFSEQRQKIFDKYGAAQEDGTFHFSEETEPKAIAELDELLDMEVSPDIQVLDIPITEDLTISVNDIDLLAPFINFTEE